jgi:hypothetical protein
MLASLLFRARPWEEKKGRELNIYGRKLAENSRSSAGGRSYKQHLSFPAGRTSTEEGGLPDGSAFRSPLGEGSERISGFAKIDSGLVRSDVWFSTMFHKLVSYSCVDRLANAKCVAFFCRIVFSAGSVIRAFDPFACAVL